MRFSFDRKASTVITAVRILGPSKEVTADLMLDTGATGSLIGSQMLLDAGYDPDAATTRSLIVTASGSINVPVLRVQRFRAFGKQALNFQVIRHDLPPALHVDGLLGLDFLRRYRLSVDFPGGFVSLRP